MGEKIRAGYTYKITIENSGISQYQAQQRWVELNFLCFHRFSITMYQKRHFEFRSQGVLWSGRGWEDVLELGVVAPLQDAPLVISPYKWPYQWVTGVLTSCKWSHGRAPLHYNWFFGPAFLLVFCRLGEGERWKIMASKKTEFVLFLYPKQNPFNIHTAKKGASF